MDFRPTIFGVAGVLGWFLFRRWREHRQARDKGARPTAEPVRLSEAPDRPRAFGFKNQWIAVPSENHDRLVSSLGLESCRVANWETGLAAAYDGGRAFVFVAPPVEGWSHAVGFGLPDVSDIDHREAWFTLLRRLSTAFGEAHYFATHRVSNYVAWALFREGVAVRIFAQADDPLLREGEPTVQETDLIASFFEGSEGEDREDLRSPDEDDVFEMAARWGVSPAQFDREDLPPSTGTVGLLARR